MYLNVILNNFLLLQTVLAVTTGFIAIFYRERKNIATPLKVTLFSCHMAIGGLLCFILSLIVTKMVSNLAQRARKTIGEGRLTLKLVTQWQSIYYLIDGLICEMNSSFGFILLVIVVYNFVWLVNASFITVLELKELGYLRLNNFFMTCTLLVVTLLVTFLISVLHGFKQEVGLLHIG